MKIALSSIDQLFGQITPPPGSGFATGPNPIGQLIAVAIRVFLIAAAIVALYYLLWGALDWITGGGDKEKIAKAQSKITNATVGMILVIVALTIFGVLTGNILGIIKNGPNGWEFTIPVLK